VKATVPSLPGLMAGFDPLFEKRVALRRLSTFLRPFRKKGDPAAAPVSGQAPRPGDFASGGGLPCIRGTFSHVSCEFMQREIDFVWGGRVRFAP